MSTSGEPETYSGEAYPSSLLKYLLQQMMMQFSAQGACIALFDESSGKMRVRMHLRAPGIQNGGLKLPGRRMTTVHLGNDTSTPSAPLPPLSSSLGRIRRESQPLPLLSQPSAPLQSTDELEEISPVQSELFAVGSRYDPGQDLIGYTWYKNEAYTMRQEDYLILFHEGQPMPYRTDVEPTYYLSVPIREASIRDEVSGNKQLAPVIGVIVLYQFALGGGHAFQPRQRGDALQYVERVALYLQNEQLRRAQQRSSVYQQRLQAISMAFPTNVKLKELVESIYEFAMQTVHVSSMLLTLYDRDTKGIYDIFAMSDGRRIEGLVEQPPAATQAERPVWWRVTQKQKKRLHFSPVNEPTLGTLYDELLGGTWGDQHHAQTFLLLPMTMYSRVTGSLCLTSTRSEKYQPEEIQVLETMVRIITVSIENAKLYDRQRHLLSSAEVRERQLTEINLRLRQRETELAAMNSALQSVSLVLDLTELLNNFVTSVAELVKSEMCVYFQLSPDKTEFMAKAIYAPPSQSTYRDSDVVETGLVSDVDRKGMHDDLIEQIRLPYKDTPLEQRVKTEGFFYLDHADLHELVQKSEEGGIIFLQVADVQQMLMIPVNYNTQLFGILAVHTLKEKSYFNPREVGTLLAICAQAASAIRNAQLFEQREEAYAELERMDKLKDEFLVTASHELRTPLSAISGYASLLRKQSERDKEKIQPQQVLRYANKIAGAAQQLTDLVGTMTEAAKMGAVDKKLDLQPVPVRVLAAADLAANLLKVNIEQHISLSIAPDLWVYADQLKVRQVLTNLLDNASKYSPPDGRIHINATRMTLEAVSNLLPEDQGLHSQIIDHGADPVVVVRVHDQGQGIHPDDAKKIFDKFVRASSSLTTPVRGTGLGLFICRRYTEAMGGRLWLERTEPNQGSTFSFFLPSIDAPLEAGAYDERE